MMEKKLSGGFGERPMHEILPNFSITIILCGKKWNMITVAGRRNVIKYAHRMK